jgi:hypothetical protein
VAAELRRHIAWHDHDRRVRQALILALDAYSYRLKLGNMVTGKLVGRLRKIAVGYEADAERARRHRGLAVTTKITREAA